MVELLRRVQCSLKHQGMDYPKAVSSQKIHLLDAKQGPDALLGVS